MSSTNTGSMGGMIGMASWVPSKGPRGKKTNGSNVSGGPRMMQMKVVKPKITRVKKSK